MKSKKGITLTSLVIYVAAMIIILGVVSTIITQFYKNTTLMQANTDEIIEFNKFNTYFLKEVKLKGNALDSIGGTNNSYILFKSGNTFLFDNNKIYYNNIEICDNVESAKFEVPDKNNTDVISVTVVFEKFNKTIDYKIEEIY